MAPERRGAGRALVRHLVAEARAAGLRALRLSVEPDNVTGRLYESELPARRPGRRGALHRRPGPRTVGRVARGARGGADDTERVPVGVGSTRSEGDALPVGAG